jgi:hypothetical protein
MDLTEEAKIEYKVDTLLTFQWSWFTPPLTTCRRRISGPAWSTYLMVIHERARKGTFSSEMLAVAAIITSPTAILTPALASAQRMAQHSTCLNNRRQIGMAPANHTDDQEGRHPPAAGHPGNAGVGRASGTTGIVSRLSPATKSQPATSRPAPYDGSIPSATIRAAEGPARPSHQPVLLFL